MSGTCSFHTAQQFMHAMQVVQAQISFSVMTSPMSLGAPLPFPASAPRGPCAP